MTEHRNDPAHDSWQALHLELQDLLAGYLDDELEDHDRERVEAHLAGCAACREDLARQRLLQERLQQLSRPSLSTAQQARLDAVVEETPAETATLPSDDRNRFRGRPWASSARKRIGAISRLFHSRWLPAVSGWTLAGVLLVAWLVGGQLETGAEPIPMVRDAIAEYQRLARSGLPEEGAPGSTPPLVWPEARPLAAWTTRIGGGPARAYALRSGDSILLQVQVTDRVFFNNPGVRKAVAERGEYEIRERQLRVIALPLKKGGVLLVGRARALPPADQLRRKLL